MRRLEYYSGYLQKESMVRGRNKSLHRGLKLVVLTDFRNSDLQTLSNMPFVPLKAEKGAAGPTVRWLPPSQCYLGGEGGESFHSKLFIFIDFGSAANAFLTACGTRSRPSVEEVAKILLTNPRQFYDLAQGPAKFAVFLKSTLVLNHPWQLPHGTS